jgi:osmotically-inducible protein OsmY
MKRFVAPALACLLGLTVSISVQAGRQADRPDNTRTNERDRGKNAPTADQQKENQTDLKTTQDIRRSIVKDKNLSTYAHNIKIVTQNGVVTLRGPVRSEEEKSAVEAKAAQVAGANHVKSELQVAPERDNSKATKHGPTN